MQVTFYFLSCSCFCLVRIHYTTSCAVCVAFSLGWHGYRSGTSGRMITMIDNMANFDAMRLTQKGVKWTPAAAIGTDTWSLENFNQTLIFCDIVIGNDFLAKDPYTLSPLGIKCGSIINRYFSSPHSSTPFHPYQIPSFCSCAISHTFSFCPCTLATCHRDLVPIVNSMANARHHKILNETKI